MSWNLRDQHMFWIWFTETSAVAAQKTAYATGADDTYPFGL
jgi:hypothetical protein